MNQKQARIVDRAIRKQIKGQALTRHEYRAIRKARGNPPGRGYQGGTPWMYEAWKVENPWLFEKAKSY